jgi:hypothetical protein
MRRDEGIHKRLEIRAPPLRKRIADLPLIINALTRELRAHRSKPLIQPRLEALNLVIRMCGWLCSWQTRMASLVRRIPCSL